MAIRSQQITITYTSWDTQANVPKSSDGVNHTLRWVKDGVESVPVNEPVEKSNGEYALTLTSTETDCDVGTLSGSSSTAGVVIVPVKVDFVRLPVVAPGDNGGLPTVDAGNFVAGIQGAKNTLDQLSDLTAVEVASAVWDELQVGHTTAGTFGAYLDAAISSLSSGSSGSTSTSTGNYLQDLVAARDNVALQLADLTANPKPTYDVDGQKVDWDTHFKALSAQLESLTLAIQGAEPFEVQTTGYTQ